jgi:hypothetical protein
MVSENLHETFFIDRTILRGSVVYPIAEPLKKVLQYFIFFCEWGTLAGIFSEKIFSSKTSEFYVYKFSF